MIHTDIGKATLTLSLEQARYEEVGENDRQYTSALSIPLRSSRVGSPVCVFQMRINVPFSLADASFVPSALSEKHARSASCARKSVAYKQIHMYV